MNAQQKVAPSEWELLRGKLSGELHDGEWMRTLYATDASIYREMPAAVAFPKTGEDIKQIIDFAREHGLGIIPRAAGTSLAGQVVGSGIVVDISRYFKTIKHVDQAGHFAWVEPGVVRDELNQHLAPYKLFYGPETSTSNRCMIGGMVGNNSCGARSIIYGSAREHLLEVRGFLADGHFTSFGELTRAEFEAKCRGEGVVSELERDIYRSMADMLSDANHQQQIVENYPKPSIPRRNTGYALDLLLRSEPFGGSERFNFCKLIAGSEGTLFFATELKINLVPALKPHAGLVCVHFDSVHESLKGNLVALKHGPTSAELIDHYILECTKENIEQRKNRFFVQGDPGAILVVEFLEDTEEALRQKAAALETDLRAAGLGHHYPLVTGDETKQVWELRKAGLGLLSNIPGDAKAIAFIEDTAVDVNDLPAYIEEFNQIIAGYGLYCVHYAHAATGELHLRPILDLKTEEGTRLFRQVATDIAHLVKRYKGSLSGEHGDGRLRGEFISFMMGEHIYRLFKDVKKTWDPWNVFNPGKIVDTPPMDTSLRYYPNQQTPKFDTMLDFSHHNGIVRAAEMCNGSADCRKSAAIGGTMCPSFMATGNEKDTTRARANMVREALSHPEKTGGFASDSIQEVMELCLSCKGCKAECPSNVDVGKLKAESAYQYYKKNGIPLRNRLVGQITAVNRLAMAISPSMYNATLNGPVGGVIKKALGFSAKRKLPALAPTTFESWFAGYQQDVKQPQGSVWLYADEFLNYHDVHIGQAAVRLLNGLGFRVEIPKLKESGRTYLSKGMLDQAYRLAEHNIAEATRQLPPDAVLLGIEPSAILTFRDEYIDLTRGELKEQAETLAKRVFLIEEFIEKLIDEGRVDRERFVIRDAVLRVHGHCHQKAMSSMAAVKKMLSLPNGYKPLLIPSGCCGMAGSFGYEEEHYDLSMQIGELVLFPTIRKEPTTTIIVASGTSCRHQINDGTGRRALHPVEVLAEALIL